MNLLQLYCSQLLQDLPLQYLDESQLVLMVFTVYTVSAEFIFYTIIHKWFWAVVLWKVLRLWRCTRYKLPVISELWYSSIHVSFHLGDSQLIGFINEEHSTRKHYAINHQCHLMASAFSLAVCGRKVHRWSTHKILFLWPFMLKQINPKENLMPFEWHWWWGWEGFTGIALSKIYYAMWK